jgi:hypothetical protein
MKNKQKEWHHATKPLTFGVNGFVKLPRGKNSCGIGIAYTVLPWNAVIYKEETAENCQTSPL